MDAHGKISAQWLPSTHAVVQVRGEIVVGKMQHLRPGTMYLVRLVGLDVHGNIIEASSIGRGGLRRGVKAGVGGGLASESWPWLQGYGHGGSEDGNGSPPSPRISSALRESGIPQRRRYHWRYSHFEL